MSGLVSVLPSQVVTLCIQSLRVSSQESCLPCSGMHLICDYPCAKMALIAVDNQAAIAALTNWLQQPGQYLVNEIHTALRVLQRVQLHMHIHAEWVPGHANVPGNE